LGAISAAAEVAGNMSLAVDVVDEIQGTGGLPPGTREGDLVACWPVLRRPPGSRALPLPPERQSWRDEARVFRHLAAVRRSPVIPQGAIPAPATQNGGTPSCTA